MDGLSSHRYQSITLQAVERYFSRAIASAPPAASAAAAAGSDLAGGGGVGAEPGAVDAHAGGGEVGAKETRPNRSGKKRRADVAVPAEVKGKVAAKDIALKFM